MALRTGILKFAMLVVGVLMWTPSAHAIVYGIDVSSWQGTINWNQVANDPKNIKFVFMKATEDTNYTDSPFNTNLAGAKAAGLLAGPYHFCRLDTNSSNPIADAVAEANYFLSRIKSKYQTGTYLPPVADIERWPSGMSTADLKTFTSTWTASFSDTIYAALGVRPIIYTSQSRAQTLFSNDTAALNPLWVAAWKTNQATSPPTNVSPWSEWKFWQYSDDSASYPGGGAISGFASGTAVDRDVFNGSLAQLSSMLLGKDPNAKPGDFNRDGLVNENDYNLWRALLGRTVPMYTSADSDGDTKITMADLAAWLENVPEPSSLVLVLMGTLLPAFSAGRNRRRAAGRV